MGCGSSAQNAKTTQVTNITVWTYYNGDQLENFTDLVDKFNETVGAEKGIVVSTESQGSVNDLEQSVMDAAAGMSCAARWSLRSPRKRRLTTKHWRSSAMRRASPACSRWTITAAALPTRTACWSFRPRFIKVDIAIIRGIDTDPDKQQIVQNIVAYAHPRSMQIIAEGVETAAELRKVIELGADALQGYFLAKPAAVPAQMVPAARKVIAEYSSASDSG